ncbi:MAG: hypothetical protein M1113_00140 [Candidatus Thermoplasmatota archaeon]|nr:hypothetical protein [Candidatus Thermoplasmatota archaeon]
MSSDKHIYANGRIVSFLYDRRECKPTGDGENHRCDVILVQIGETLKENKLWVIECKSKVKLSHAKKAIEQIDGCIDVIHNAKGWKIEKCVIGKSFSNEAAIKLSNAGIMHATNTPSNQCENIKDIIVAVQKVKGFK